MSRTNSYGFLTPCQHLEKTNDPTPRNVRTDPISYETAGYCWGEGGGTNKITTEQPLTCSKSTIDTLKKAVKHVQS